MAKTNIPDLVPDPATVKENYLSDIKQGLYSIGLSNVNTAPGSAYDVDADNLVGIVSSIYNLITIAGDSVMPDTASDEDLDRQLTTRGLSRRSAGGSVGQIQLATDFSTFVATGSELTSSTSIRYSVITGGFYNNNDLIPIQSVDVGSKTNLDSGVLNWTSPPTGAKTTAVIAIALTGGIDDETDEDARARLTSRIQNVPSAGNPQQLAELAESTSPAVQKAFVYRTPNGPSTQHVAVIGRPALVTKSRQIDPILMNQTIKSTILGNTAIGPETVVTSVQDVPVDIAFALTIPLAKSSSSIISGPGNGLGWLDGTPWPRVNLSTHFFTPVTAVTDNANFTVDAPAGVPPIAGITRICWISKTGSSWTVNTATVNSFLGTGPYTLSISTPFIGISVGDWIFPAALSMQNYLDSGLNGFANMGPGEKCNLAVQGESARFPRQSDSYPSNIDSSLLRYIIDAGNEVQTCNYFYRSIQTPAVVNDANANNLLIPNRPTQISNPPNVFIPRNLAFYPPFPLQ